MIVKRYLILSNGSGNYAMKMLRYIINKTRKKIRINSEKNPTYNNTRIYNNTKINKEKYKKESNE